ncbi:alpha/beta hydrolase [Chryseobacterium takakiae]|uniref:Pimeloyl-ACP methyl ester carboxylesterase n=1 Tax=Chryseobacterium takakiae TaxID=1302685 RepID=A0A1M4WA62_9FLAO|nr:alpha/beta hydrolase [Chryseobacterium takakiae]SHE78099.1 Pimeloyl-ACP methyl ester carboxylesterase [Chryseobacterium takakiae]
MNENVNGKAELYSDAELIKNFPGFENKYTSVNGIELHYVEGGQGEPLLCLPGWPQTWYSLKPVALKLAEKYRVIIVDLRGMGTSEKPESGYDKKTMATDIYELVLSLGLEKVSLMGHDIGGMVAMSFAFNFPESTEKLIVLDGSHPSEGMYQMPLIPSPGKFNEKMDGEMPYAWWMGFNQVKGLPEQLLEGRFHLLQDWLFNYVMIDESKMTEFERSVYAHAYNDKESIRASNAWYQNFNQDIEDLKHYQKLQMPVLGIGSYISYNYMNYGLPFVANDLEVFGIMNSGHYLFEEKPQEVLDIVFKFLDSKKQEK